MKILLISTQNNDNKEIMIHLFCKQNMILLYLLHRNIVLQNNHIISQALLIYIKMIIFFPHPSQMRFITKSNFLNC